MTAALLDEGAGELDANAFQEQLERNAIELSLQRRPRSFPRLAAHAEANAATRRSTCCGSR